MWVSFSCWTQEKIFGNQTVDGSHWLPQYGKKYYGSQWLPSTVLQLLFTGFSQVKSSHLNRNICDWECCVRTNSSWWIYNMFTTLTKRKLLERKVNSESNINKIIMLIIVIIVIIINKMLHKYLTIPANKEHYHNFLTRFPQSYEQTFFK